MHVVPGQFALYAEVVEASPDVEVSVHAPLVTIGISNDPIWHIFFIVKTPTY